VRGPPRVHDLDLVRRGPGLDAPLILEPQAV
jgi:hypothetical protein